MADFPLMAGQGIHDAGVDLTLSRGVGVTPHATANTKGSWTELVAAASSAGCGLFLGFGPNIGLVGTDGYARLMDIGIGAAASEQVKIPNIATATNAAVNNLNIGMVFFPLQYAKGARVTIRAQADVASGGAGQVSCHLVPASPLMPVGPSKYDAYGVDTATSVGTQHNTGATANTKAAASTEIVASTLRRHRVLFLVFTVDPATAAATVSRGLVDLCVGAGATPPVLAPNLLIGFSSPVNNGIIGPIYTDLPAGSRLSVRGQASVTATTSARDLRYSILAA